MITVLQSAQLASATYAGVPADWDRLIQTGDFVGGLKTIDGAQVLAIRGILTAADWMHDAEAWPEWDREIGFVHAGFLADVDDALAQIEPLLTGPLTIQGHSLGGARARIVAAKLLVRGKAVARVCTFGSPKPGFANVARILQKSGCEHVSYRNRNDPVPLVPGILPDWVHPEPWIAMNEAPGGDVLEALRDHSMDLYMRGAAKV